MACAETGFDSTVSIIFRSERRGAAVRPGTASTGQWSRRASSAARPPAARRQRSPTAYRRARRRARHSGSTEAPTPKVATSRRRLGDRASRACRSTTMKAQAKRGREEDAGERRQRRHGDHARHQGQRQVARAPAAHQDPQPPLGRPAHCRAPYADRRPARPARAPAISQPYTASAAVLVRVRRRRRP